jgi:c-di-GMP-binding flagellar brake protein YcgR
MPEPPSNKERRKWQRLKVDFTLNYRVDAPLEVRMSIGWDSEVDALMVDLSEGGMAILTNCDIPASSILSINFTLINLSAIEDDERIKTLSITGEVRSNIIIDKTERRLGIKFIQISQKDKEAIGNFVRMTLNRNPESPA